MKPAWAVFLLAVVLVACGRTPAAPSVVDASGRCLLVGTNGAPTAAPLAASVPSGAPSPSSLTPQARGVIIKFRSAGAAAGVWAQALSLGGQGGTLALLDAADPVAAAKAWRARKDVVYAVPNAVVHALGAAPATFTGEVVPTDEFARLQWTYPLLGYGKVWRDMRDNPYQKPVTVATLDTGVRYDHPDLLGALWCPGQGTLDLVPSAVDGGDDYGMDEDPTDPTYEGRDQGSHGTHVAGIIAARWNGVGVAGAVWNAPVKILPVRVLNDHGAGDLWTVVQGLRYAAGLPISFGGKTRVNPHPAQVINLSLGEDLSAEDAQPLCNAVTDATKAGSLIVAAAGNKAVTKPFYPAACAGAVAVASVSLGAGGVPEHAPYSNVYAQVALSAPGGDHNNAYNGATLDGLLFRDLVFSTSWDYTDNQPNYEGMEGTSQATPQVSALAALLLSKGVASTGAQVTARMEATARDLGDKGRDPQFGFGMIDAAAALGVR